MNETTSQPVIVPVLLCGGSGKNLWPVSRAMYPKQFQRFNTTHTLLQEAALRVNKTAFHSPLVIGTEEHRFFIAEQLHVLEIQPADIILEPEGRDTAAAIITAGLWMHDNHPSGLMLIMPSDHKITDHQAFCEAVMSGVGLAQSGKLVCFSNEPTSPDPTMTYLKPADVTKPAHQDEARILIDAGYLWNTGIYLVSEETLMDNVRLLAPDLLELCHQTYANKTSEHDFIRLDEQFFKPIARVSFEELILEHTANAAMLPVTSDWQDMRTWKSVFHGAVDQSLKDKNGNIIDGDVVVLDTKNSLIRSDGILTTTIGVNNLAIVINDDAVLISDIDKLNELGPLIEQVAEHGAEHGTEQHLHHRTVYRPWGSFTSILSAPGFQVKKLFVKPGAILSLQKHAHRAEHWVVVEGTAEVTLDDAVFLLSENQSCFIPLGAVHRLHNPGKIPLLVIEVQCGAYLGEDDIVRIEDTYGRQ